MRRLRWERPGAVPKHPYRDTAILYALFAAIIVVVTAISGGNLLPGGNARSGALGSLARAGAVPVAAGFFVLATGFSWWRFRLRQERDRDRQQP
jgi:hypothetical protein